MLEPGRRPPKVWCVSRTLFWVAVFFPVPFFPSKYSHLVWWWGSSEAKLSFVDELIWTKHGTVLPEIPQKRRKNSWNWLIPAFLEIYRNKSISRKKFLWIFSNSIALCNRDEDHAHVNIPNKSLRYAKIWTWFSKD